MTISVPSNGVVIRYKNLAVSNRVIQPRFTESDHVWFTGGSIGSDGVKVWDETAATGGDNHKERRWAVRIVLTGGRRRRGRVIGIGRI